MNRPQYSLFVLLFLLFCQKNALFAQQNTISGFVFDDTRQPLEAASLALIALPDSTLHAVVLTDSTGGFAWKNVPSGRFRLLVNYIGYTPFDTSFTVRSNQQFHLNNIVLASTTFGLNEVEIKAKATPIIVRNDTIYFNASSFETEKNAAVIELLRALPGLEIDDEGNIKAQGKAVLNILVDGKPFFNGDQNTTTRVLPADAIQTVEVYNQTSREADFSGMKDGENEKTINLVLKEDRKKGWFGSLGGSAGGSRINEQRHAMQFNANRFAPKYQLALTSNLSNLAPGFGSAGFQRSQSANADLGLHRKNDNTTYYNYSFNGLSQQQRNEVSRQVMANGGGFTNRENSASDGNNYGHSLSFSSTHNRDTTRVLSLNMNANTNITRQSDWDTTSTRSNAGTLINSGYRQKNDDGENNSLNCNLSWGQRLRTRKNINFMVSPSFNRGNSTQNGRLDAVNSFVEKDSTTLVVDTIRQRNYNNDLTNAFDVSAQFTAELSQKLTFQLNYDNNTQWQTSSIAIFDQLERSELRNDSLSSNYSSRVGTQQWTANAQWEAEKWSLALITGLQRSTLSSRNTNPLLLPVQQQYLNAIAGVSADYNFSESKRINLYYWTDASQPGEDQLQPVPDRSDPLNVRYGNPDLRPEQSHALSVGFNHYHPKKLYNFSLNAEVGYVQHKIMEVISIDERFVRHYRPENTPGAVSGSLSLNYGKPIRVTKGSYSISAGVQTSKGEIFLNDRLNTSVESGANTAVFLQYKLVKWLNVRLSARYALNKVEYSVDKNLEQQYSSQQYGLNTTLRLPKKWVVQSNFNLSVNRGLSAGFNRTIPIWNLEASRSFLKNDALTLTVSANDLLNKNIGLQRSVSLNTIEDRKTNALSRYFLVSAQYMLRQI
jgi:hypothetical protein